MYVSPGLPPWEAPVMIAEKRKLFFCFIFFFFVFFLFIYLEHVAYAGW